ncbi:hypothetical protein Patl1_18538 [Pistacia atlantica]|uniref:Uncharacterized protein n=1 Tax=Pistacia atlantica TaxID=434234 RepID=A0ACC1C164_9ROSI|nr:hypothetical protein Patl1_18538 [Pistacia atlantica]
MFNLTASLVPFLATAGGWIEARGFIFGPSIALAIGAKFVPLRKPKKLPGEVISEEYILEYGRDCLEMHVGAVEPGERALVVDDLIATGGTLCAAYELTRSKGSRAAEWQAIVCTCGGSLILADKPFPQHGKMYIRGHQESASIVSMISEF